ncbi:MAG: hypothetical protein CL429_02595 [Acidimicrobiaceae bacterium]|nr:hypothetical protein [Acidimicrobiaceae bacterium]
MGILVKHDSTSKRTKSLGKAEKQSKKNGGSGETRTHNQRLKRLTMLLGFSNCRSIGYVFYLGVVIIIPPLFPP